MHLESYTDPLMQKFISLAAPLRAHCEYMFGRNLYCTIFNPLRRPENQIFLLRPAKSSELARLDASLVEPEEIAALTELKLVARLAWPTAIANFRLYFNGQSPAEAFLINIYGEQSPIRAIDYFRPRSSRTLLCRCLKLGGYCWHGPKKAIEPFLKFCSPPHPLPRRGLDDENQENFGSPI
jgi:hypothetical protein